MDSQRFLSWLRAHSGFSSDEQALGCAQRVLAGVVSIVPIDVGREVLGWLPESLAESVGDQARPNSLEPDQLSDYVRGEQKASEGVIREEIEVVLQSFGRLLAPDQRSILQDRLPSELGSMLEPPQVTHEPDQPSHGGRTLASGSPGSNHPVSSSSPHPEHSESLAATDSPHADRKLATTEGLTQEREHEDLATGKGPKTRPISESKD